MLREVFALAAARSPIGTFNGSLSSFKPEELAAIVAKDVIARAKFDPLEIDSAIIGNVIPCTETFPYIARIASINAGMSHRSTALACNRLCGSGMQAIISTAESIALGSIQSGLAGGVEVMSRSAYLSAAMRQGARMGDATLIDIMLATLNDPFGAGHMGITAENQAEKWEISRKQQDSFALLSQQRAKAAITEGRFKSQITPISIKSRKGHVIVDTDEHPKDTSLEILAGLKPAFKKEGGTVTAGNSSGINDGASFVLLGNAEAAKKSHHPLGRLVAYAICGVEPHLMGDGPIPASKLALQRAGLSLDQMDVIEANEAFAAQSLSVMKGLVLDPLKTNPNGGAIALGHPVGATGAVIVTKLLYEMARINARYGMAIMCIGGGQGITTIWERA